MNNSRVKSSIFLILLFILILPWWCRCAPLQFETINKGYYSGYTEKAFLAIKTQDEWRRTWEVHAGIRLPLEDPPEIDFTKEMIIAVFRGECPTGGYTIEIDTIEEMEDKILVYLIETRPGPGSIVTQALTQPYHIVKIRRSDLSVDIIYPVRESHRRRIPLENEVL